MEYYHCSPTSGLKLLEPRQPKNFDKPSLVYMTTLLPMALMYGIQNYEYTYGYTKEGQIYLDEYFPNALEILYRGKAASLYRCAPETTGTTKIPNEVTSDAPVPVLEEIVIADVCEALLEQERLGTLAIRRYDSLTSQNLAWIEKTQADIIRQHKLLERSDSQAEYYRRHYPESWAKATSEIE